MVAADRDDAEELRRLHEFQRGLGLDSEWLAPRAARELEPGLSPRIAGAIAAPQDGQVDPAAVVAALARALAEAGGELLEGAAVEGLTTGGRPGDGRAAARFGGRGAARCWSPPAPGARSWPRGGRRQCP